VHKIANSTFTDMVTFQGHWSEVGLGETGEAYIVGPDLKLRTESRFVKEMPEKMKSLSFEPDGSAGPLTSILGAPLHNTAVENIFGSNLVQRR